MQINELAGRTGVSARSLRYYEQKQLITSCRLDNGYRDFDEAAIERVKTIQFYFGLGLTTDQIKQIINCQGKHALSENHPLCDEVLSLYEDKLQEVEEQIAILHAVQARLKERIASFQRMKATASRQDADFASGRERQDDTREPSTLHTREHQENLIEISRN